MPSKLETQLLSTHHCHRHRLSFSVMLIHLLLRSGIPGHLLLQCLPHEIRDPRGRHDTPLYAVEIVILWSSSHRKIGRQTHRQSSNCQCGESCISNSNGAHKQDSGCRTVPDIAPCVMQVINPRSDSSSRCVGSFDSTDLREFGNTRWANDLACCRLLHTWIVSSICYQKNIVRRTSVSFSYIRVYMHWKNMNAPSIYKRNQKRSILPGLSSSRAKNTFQVRNWSITSFDFYASTSSWGNINPLVVQLLQFLIPPLASPFPPFLCVLGLMFSSIEYHNLVGNKNLCLCCC